MEQHDAMRGAHPSDPAEGAAPDTDPNSPAQQRRGVRKDGEADTRTADPDDAPTDPR
jgi:hypothetical protein